MNVSPPLSASGLLCGMLLAIFSLFWIVSDTSAILSFSLFKSLSLDMKGELIFSKMDLLFSGCVILISLSVMLFSSTYMQGDPNLKYFTIMVMMFVMSMNFLIYIPHMVMLLLGWDGLGLTSYLLVVYYMSDQSLGSGMITALSNRLGDALIIMSLSLCYFNMSFSYHAVIGGSSIIFLLMCLASFTKSAQIPFSAWLPAAMAAPTPVSALVHSSTLVTAGIFLLCRFYGSLSDFSFFSVMIFYLGVMTCLMASMSAIFENDLKKIIALSTLSQLGVMMFTLGLGFPGLSFFHLITHAMFKALMFICAGTVIHNQGGVQDVRLMGNIWHSMPGTCSALVGANMALCGYPFMAGFYSKDMIMECFMSGSYPVSSSILCFLSVLLTGIYTSRLCYFLLWKSSSNSSYMLLTDESVVTYISYCILLSGALFSGSLMMSFFHPCSSVLILPMIMKLMTLGFIVLLGVSVQLFITLNMKSGLFYFMISMWNLGLISSNFSFEVLSSSKKMMMMESSWAEFSLLWSASKVKDLTVKGQNSLSSGNLYWVVSGMFFICVLLCCSTYK
uniref:NADH dehydrogenase subunit 5 n=1 Tax=Membranipora villosa TaxID=2857147 RepID=UPI002E7A132A|nr:NADH dehydrogenase subunit 5 [Membranipora villosa]WQB41569.1 NADH dehydrogenase subunit 5 [Membranipora villosa]